MSSSLIIITGFIYLYVSIEQGLIGNTAMAITYASYSAANIGLWMMASK
jgi:hypothetical protein